MNSHIRMHLPNNCKYITNFSCPDNALQHPKPLHFRTCTCSVFGDLGKMSIFSTVVCKYM